MGDRASSGAATAGDSPAMAALPGALRTPETVPELCSNGQVAPKIASWLRWFLVHSCTVLEVLPVDPCPAAVEPGDGLVRMLRTRAARGIPLSEDVDVPSVLRWEISPQTSATSLVVE